MPEMPLLSECPKHAPEPCHSLLLIIRQLYKMKKIEAGSFPAQTQYRKDFRHSVYLYSKANYNLSRTIIRAYPSKFCPFHLARSNLLGSFIESPIPQIRCLTAHSAKNASPVPLSSYLKFTFCENFSNNPSKTTICRTPFQ